MGIMDKLGMDKKKGVNQYKMAKISKNQTGGIKMEKYEKWSWEQKLQNVKNKKV